MIPPVHSVIPTWFFLLWGMAVFGIIAWCVVCDMRDTRQRKRDGR